MTYKVDKYHDTGWWRNHFSGVMLDLWESIVPKEQASKDADFLELSCGLSAGARVLDVPCGDGRVALELARRGYHLVGVDISPGLLKEARRQADLQKLQVEWHESDMRSLPQDCLFQAAFCWGDSFGYLDDNGNREFLLAVQNVLAPKGAWAMEMQMLTEVLLPRFRPVDSAEVDNIRVEIRREYKSREGRLSVDYTLTREGKTDTRTASYRVYSCDEVCKLIEGAGFRVEQIVDGKDAPFQPGADRLRIVSAKT